MLTAENVVAAIMDWPGLYETRSGYRFLGSPVSEVPTRLREARWRRVSHLNDERLLNSMGLEILEARYVGGVRPKRFCSVVKAGEYVPESDESDH